MVLTEYGMLDGTEHSWGLFETTHRRDLEVIYGVPRAKMLGFMVD